MTPSSILEQLARVRRRERLLRLLWGGTTWLGVVCAALLFACSLDWLIDRWVETPWTLRYLLFLGQMILAGGAAAILIVLPQLQRMRDDDLALWVEGRVPDFQHRLISAVQLNRPSALTAGMSPALIERVTQEAESRAQRTDFVALLDHRRIQHSGLLGLGLLVLVMVATLALGFSTLAALIARQLLVNVDVPRSVQIEILEPDQVLPSGEAASLRFRVKSRIPLDRLSGVALIAPAGRPSEDYPLELETTAGPGEGIFTASVPASSVDFSYRAWLGDGRTRRLGVVSFEPRPAVRRQNAWVQLPDYCGKRPDGSPYEQFQPRGEVVGLLGSSVRVAIETQKPVTEASVEILGQPAPEVLAWFRAPSAELTFDPLAEMRATLTQLLSLQVVNEVDSSAAGRTVMGPELVRRRVPLRIQPDGTKAVAVFDLRPSETAYRIVLKDRHGFTNAEAPRRGLSVVPDEPPSVELLPEHFTSEPGQPLSTETEVEGKPVPVDVLGGKIRIAYRCQDAYGLARAQLRYRILRKEDPENPGPWVRLRLDEVKAGPSVGPFDPRQGVFRNSGLDDQIEFFAEPSPDLNQTPGRADGGGRFDFQTGALGLRIGDQVEYYVEVFDNNPDPTRNLGRSEARRKLVVQGSELTDWLLRKAEHENRIRDLEKRQREVPVGQTPK